MGCQSLASRSEVALLDQLAFASKKTVMTELVSQIDSHSFGEERSDSAAKKIPFGMTGLPRLRSAWNLPCANHAKSFPSLEENATTPRFGPNGPNLDEAYSVGEFCLKLLGWQTERRFVVIREVVREGRDSVGRKLIDVPGYVFRIFVTTHTEAPEEIWRDYNLRSDMENRIAELKHDLGADGFCLQQFFATEAAFRAILLLFNLLAEFQRAAQLPRYREPATLRTQVLTCGAILGRAGRRLVLHLSHSWGGLQTRNPLLDNIFAWQFPTSPKLDSVLAT